ncbi:MAG TPA: Vps62-related protein [Blastocatellia bacterium]|nr:Vps62-related protein [Blastocatellia bacterium]
MQTNNRKKLSASAILMAVAFLLLAQPLSLLADATAISQPSGVAPVEASAAPPTSTSKEILTKTMKDGQEVEALYIKYVTDFRETWNTIGRPYSEVAECSFWHPQIPAGYQSLGDYVVAKVPYEAQDNPTNKVAVVAVKAPVGSEALKSPVDYKEVWNTTGYSGKYNVSVWEPVPPPGYVGLGVVTLKYGEGVSHAKPKLDAITCVRKDLTEVGRLRDKPVWKYNKHGQHDDPFSAWEVDITEGPLDAYIRISANSFVGHRSTDRPRETETTPLNVLKLIMPNKTHQEISLTQQERTDKLTSLGVPTQNDHTQWIVTRTTEVPFVSVVDRNRTTRWKIDNSPGYILERSEAWQCLSTMHAGSGAYEYTHSDKVGWSKEERTTVSETLGIKVGVEAGYSGPGGGGGSFKVSTELNYEFGIQSESASSQYAEQTVETKITIPSKSAVARWSRSVRFRVLRANGEEVYSKILHTTDTALIEYGPTAKTFANNSKLAE